MLFHRIVSEGLSHYSYFVADGSDAVVIDPRRDIDVYLLLARQRGLRIRYAFETHRNEDYAIGSTALAQATGCEVLHSGKLPFEYGTAVRDGDWFEVGRLRFTALSTPGHTRESLTLAMEDTAAADVPAAAFTGDALFVGDTGRIDLMGVDRREAAALLYGSIAGKILPLGDGAVLCPAHGGGSVCGGAISDRTLSSLGYERLAQPELRDEQAFLLKKLAEAPVVPPYFRRMEEWNLRGNAPVYERLPELAPLLPGELAERQAGGATVVDARMPQAFAAGHIPGSYNVWLDGLSSYLPWVAPPEATILLVLPEGADTREVTRRLLRIGYDGVAGYLAGGFESWQNEGRPIGRFGTVDSESLRLRMAAAQPLTLLDVREPAEWRGGTVVGAEQIFVGDLEGHLDDIPRDRPAVTMCSVGHRGGVAASILARAGFRDVANYLGGYTAWRRTS